MADQKKRKLRGQFTGGERDVKEFYECLTQIAEEKGFDLDFYDLKAFGDVGPMRKLVFGFIQKD